jgi:hypothetical protein
MHFYTRCDSDATEDRRSLIIHTFPCNDTDAGTRADRYARSSDGVYISALSMTQLTSDKRQFMDVMRSDTVHV